MQIIKKKREITKLHYGVLLILFKINLQYDQVTYWR